MGVIFMLTSVSAMAQSAPEWNREIGENDLPAYMEGSPYGFGFGAFAGTPSGLGLALSYSQPKVLSQAVISWSPPETLRLTADQYVQIFSVRKTSQLSFPVMIGLGGYLRYNEVLEKHLQGDSFETWAGLRSPIMMLMHHEFLALDVYGELAPSWQAYPSHRRQFHIDGGVGFRWYYD